MRLTALIVAMLAAQASADEVAKLFSDQGKTYVRSDNPAAFVIGTELPAFSDAAGTKSAGRAVVMEIVGQLCRVSLDDAAVKASAKFVRLKGPGGAQALPPAPPSAAGPPPPPPPPAAGPPPPTPPPAAAPPTGGPLVGKVEPTDKGVIIRNTSDVGWNGCELKWSDRRFAPVGKVDARQAFTIPETRVNDAPELPYDRITVRCAEGEADFLFDQPALKTALQGFVENGRKGGIQLHNDGPTDWTRCDLIKPDRTHFVQGTLKAHSWDSIRGGLFKPPTVEEPPTVTLKCLEGSITARIP